MKDRFDFDKAVKELAEGKKIIGKDALIKQLVEATLEWERISYI